MTIENKLQLFLLKEYDFCDYIKTENETLYFECVNEFSDDEIDLVSCVPFENDDNRKGYEIFFTREVHFDNHTSKHTAPITHVFENEL